MQETAVYGSRLSVPPLAAAERVDANSETSVDWIASRTLEARALSSASLAACLARAFSRRQASRAYWMGVGGKLLLRV